MIYIYLVPVNNPVVDTNSEWVIVDPNYLISLTWLCATKICNRNKASHQLRKRMDIFCSTSVLSRELQNSWNEIIWSPSLSASTIVRSAMLTNCSSLLNK